MTHVLYVEGSLCLSTGVAGWGSALVNEARPGEHVTGGPLQGDFGGSSTLMELAAAAVAVQTALPQLRGHRSLTLAMRSTAALAVLRWVFPKAPMQSTVEIHPPKRLKRFTQAFDPLYDLADDIETALLTLTLRLAEGSEQTVMAYEMARSWMEHQRLPARRATR